ncbi:MAG: type 4a pilus biogenesis protein PilO [Patescibacteria group bacterium]|jgi:hypothetical protein
MSEENKEQQSNPGGQKIVERQFNKMKENKPEIEEQQLSFFMVLFRKYFYYFLLVEIIIIIAAGYLFLLKPKMDIVFKNNFEAATQESKEAQLKLNNYNRQIAGLKEIKSEYEKISDADLNMINRMLPREKNESDLFLQIEKIVKGNGLLLESIFLEKEETDSAKKRSKRDMGEGAEAQGSEISAEELKIKLIVSEAGYPAFKSLISSLESNLRIIDVDAIKYDPADESAELSLKAYYWPKEI